MDRELWQTLKASVRRVCRPCKRDNRLRFSHQQVLLMFFWCVWQGKCLAWACDRSHYGSLFRPRRLPSVSQFRRRVAQDDFQALLGRVHAELARAGMSCPLKLIDGKPLLVSPVSKDPDARRGHITGGYGKGYKLHAIVAEDRRVIVWSLTALNAAEQTVAVVMAGHLKPAADAAAALALADSNYDSAPLHKALAPSDHRLLSPLKAQQRVKGGQHHPVTLRQMGPARREAVQVWQDHADLARYVLNRRNRIEGVLSAMTVVFNAGNPPPWVRRLARVRRWIGAVIILHNARVAVQERQARIARETQHRA
ncbi:MAG TPA: transposase [Acidobacteriaceae bacterium]|nr:transposase [Acidobacteriaceae bacterium]